MKNPFQSLWFFIQIKLNLKRDYCENINFYRRIYEWVMAVVITEEICIYLEAIVKKIDERQTYL